MSKKTRNQEFVFGGESIKQLMQLSGLEIGGLAEFTGISESHIYALVNGTRNLTEETADKIAIPFNLSGKQLLKPDLKLSKKIASGIALKRFYTENKGVRNYFIDTRIDRKAAFFVEYEILPKKKFNFSFYVRDVRNACFDEGKKYESKRVSQILNYLVEQKKLKRKKEPIIRKDGSSGNRLVDVFTKVKRVSKT